MNETLSILIDITVQPQNHKKGSQENEDETYLRKRLLVLHNASEKQILILRNPEIQTHKTHCPILSVLEVPLTPHMLHSSPTVFLPSHCLQK